MKKMINNTHVEGRLYQFKLEAKVSGENSKTPGTEYIRGSIDIATDEACTNIVSIFFTYVTATYGKSNKPNPNFGILTDIINKKYKTVLEDGADVAAKFRVDSAIGLNEFYSDKNGTEELVSAKRNDGGFIHSVQVLNPDEALRATFEVDLLITNVREIEADPDSGREAKAIIRGAAFDFRNSLLPIELSVTSPSAMNYFLGLDASQKQPVFTKVRGKQVSQIIKRTITEESAFGEAYVREIDNTKRDFVVDWAPPTPYEWDSDETITVAELTKAMNDRATYLAEMKAKNEEFKARQADGSTATATSTATAAAPAQEEFNF